MWSIVRCLYYFAQVVNVLFCNQIVLFCNIASCVFAYICKCLEEGIFVLA